jgi:hypothetical protein
MNAVSKGHHLLKGSTAPTPPDQCEVLGAFRHGLPLCQRIVLREKASRPATRSANPVAAESRTSTAASLLAEIGKYYRTSGLQMAKLVSR